MVYKFGTFEFDGDSAELRKSGRVVALEPQPARALALLLARTAEHPDVIVTREELRDAVWGTETHVDFERGIAYCVSQIRAALGDSGDNPRFLQTVPKRGFRFVAPITAPSPLAPSAVLPFPPPAPPAAKTSKPLAIAGVILLATLTVFATFVELRPARTAPAAVVIGVSIFDNETGSPSLDRPVAGLSDLVVEHLTKLDPARIAVIGNAAILRQPRNIRNLQGVARELKADYVLLGQLQRGESGLRFITHFIRLADEKHLRANRIAVADESLAGLEAAVVQEFERSVREHILNPPQK
ncbi:MAG: hypothetical protein RLZZ53_1241 [Acidobacteriota bacterium]